MSEEKSAAVAAKTERKLSWTEWARERGVSAAVLRGACVLVKADKDCLVTQREFDRAVQAFRNGGVR